ncbi:hypothetical protein GCM10011507_15400 [Edaphobacter acidisoli]|uniref:Uncharacterized protein n=1 Tax=Edaphobacter acidisoli TaxID=2040573 RepID=A0A916W3M5_9BACT|nr:hypothetical protein [Edaphobacter acidisoli]GGA64686.1 hypothetical protein GCM10011507_15400 [Edaphobacter acidisoli]
MASTQTNFDAAQEASNPATGSLLIYLTAMPLTALEAELANFALAFPNQSVLVAAPDNVPDMSSGGPLSVIPYPQAASPNASWVLTAADYVNASKLIEEHGATTCLLLGAESHTLQPEAVRALAETAASYDLAVARYDLGPHDGLVNSAILYPVTRALFGTRPRFPLAIDLGLSKRMATRLAGAAQKFTSANQPDSFVWPVIEAATANFSMAETNVGTRALPQPVPSDLNSLLGLIAGSLFSEIEIKASFWQRARSLQYSSAPLRDVALAEGSADVNSMIEAFHFAYTNLHEIWSLILTPNSLLGLKRLNASPTANFNMPYSLWTRIVYDFILGYRLRTINRNHLLGALTPLYLAWAASHLILTSNSITPEQHIQEQAAAFESDKPYLVSRWRWPDRFTP